MEDKHLYRETQWDVSAEADAALDAIEESGRKLLA